MNQSNARPKRPRPVARDLIFTDSVAVQLSPQMTVKVFSCPDHWPSISAPNTNIPACQLNPICPPAMAPLGLPEPVTRVLLNSVAPPAAVRSAAFTMLDDVELAGFKRIVGSFTEASA